MYTVILEGKIPFNSNARLFSQTTADFNEAVRRAETIARNPSETLRITQYHSATPTKVKIQFRDKAAVLAQHVPEYKIENVSGPLILEKPTKSRHILFQKQL
jgi:hypothetical protein